MLTMLLSFEEIHNASFFLYKDAPNMYDKCLGSKISLKIDIAKAF